MIWRRFLYDWAFVSKANGHRFSAQRASNRNIFFVDSLHQLFINQSSLSLQWTLGTLSAPPEQQVIRTWYLLSIRETPINASNITKILLRIHWKKRQFIIVFFAFYVPKHCRKRAVIIRIFDVCISFLSYPSKFEAWIIGIRDIYFLDWKYGCYACHSNVPELRRRIGLMQPAHYSIRPCFTCYTMFIVTRVCLFEKWEIYSSQI